MPRSTLGTRDVRDRHPIPARVREDYDFMVFKLCLLYTSDAADDLLCVDLGGRRIIKKKNK